MEMHSKPRTYLRKEDSMLEEDLESLRNHHDLLATLYWATPSPVRPRIEIVRSLVDHTSSHREACRVNVKTWANLAKYQISTCEPRDALHPFSAWYREIIEQSINQFRLARSEAEDHFELARDRSDGLVTSALLESVVARNQNLILATIVDAMAGLKASLLASRDAMTAASFLHQCQTQKAFALFDGKRTRTETILLEGADVYLAMINTLNGPAESSLPRQQQESEKARTTEIGRVLTRRMALPLPSPSILQRYSFWKTRTSSYRTALGPTSFHPTHFSGKSSTYGFL